MVHRALHGLVGQAVSSGRRALCCSTAPIARPFHASKNDLRYISTDVSGTGNGIDSVEISGKSFQTDEWFNLPVNIANLIGRRLHLLPDHPVSITRQIIESKFPSPTYLHHNHYDPIVSKYQNFDSLGFPGDHPGRSKSDTYYINEETCLRTHTSAHQVETFKRNASQGFLISADVYRRDAVDRSHYPVFHQMEGARMWDRTKLVGADLAKEIYLDLARLPKHDMVVEDIRQAEYDGQNPRQHQHTEAEVGAIASHLKRSLELVVAEIFRRAEKAAQVGPQKHALQPLRVRWIEAYFPFTSPSWELEIFWQGEWLEVLGCGVVQQDILHKAGMSQQSGWAFGIGLERIAMLLFEIPDIRLFWSSDPRFLKQFEGVSGNLESLKRFIPFSRHPSCYKDVAFWLPASSGSSAGGAVSKAKDFHGNDVMEIVRDIVGDVAETVNLVDVFVHPATGRKSMCYRINYRSLERNLTNEDANGFHSAVEQALVEKLGVDLR